MIRFLLHQHFNSCSCLLTCYRKIVLIKLLPSKFSDYPHWNSWHLKDYIKYFPRWHVKCSNILRTLRARILLGSFPIHVYNLEHVKYILILIVWEIAWPSPSCSRKYKVVISLHRNILMLNRIIIRISCTSEMILNRKLWT